MAASDVETTRDHHGHRPQRPAGLLAHRAESEPLWAAEHQFRLTTSSHPDHVTCASSKQHRRRPDVERVTAWHGTFALPLPRPTQPPRRLHATGHSLLRWTMTSCAGQDCSFVRKPALCGGRLDPPLTAPLDGGCRENRSTNRCDDWSWDNTGLIGPRSGHLFWDDANVTAKVLALLGGFRPVNAVAEVAQVVDAAIEADVRRSGARAPRVKRRRRKRWRRGIPQRRRVRAAWPGVRLRSIAIKAGQAGHRRS